MAVTPPTQGFFGSVFIGGSRYTIAAAPQFRAPRNIQTAPAIANGQPYLYGQGVLFPTVTLKLIPRDEAAGSGRGNPLSSAFWAYVLGRSAVPLYDTTAIGGTQPGTAPAPPILGTDIANAAGAGIAFTDGARLTLMYGVKLESITISSAKGSDLSIEATFIGTGFWQYDTVAASLGADATQSLIQSMLPTSGECAAQVRFASVTFSESALAQSVFGFNLSYRNNHTPNMALDGSYFPTQHNAGMPSGGLNLTLQALDIPPGDLASSSGASATLNISTATRTLQLYAQRLVIENPYDQAAPLGRVMRNYGYTLMGSCSVPNTSTDDLLRIISSTF